MHDNDEFAAVLSQLDEHDWTSPAKSAGEKNNPKMDTVSPKSPKISSSKCSPLKTSPTPSKKESLTPDKEGPSNLFLKQETSPVSSKSRKSDNKLSGKTKFSEESSLKSSEKKLRSSPRSEKCSKKSPESKKEDPVKVQLFQNKLKSPEEKLTPLPRSDKQLMKSPVKVESKDLNVAKTDKSPAMEKVWKLEIGFKPHSHYILKTFQVKT